MKDIPEGKTYWTRACQWARCYTFTPSLRCKNCPFKGCYEDDPTRMIPYFVERIEVLKKDYEKIIHWRQ